ncbi:DUF748 domain-containing protein [Methylomonas methanica]|uniref:DUF748 domain-containing protein n=1 Tax=Methylomonas methanica (strain DSM 25384 / MC09) TaxID=857087 RepID=F9ZYD0_METMM|nr:DUF748 domain-containing protein [Methylomonas methanica]AEG01035.1 protein of unknown function DUF748 [Methylomonas methanica MC09]
MLKKILIFCAVIAVLLGCYAGAGFYLLPKLAKDKLPALLSEKTGQTVQLQDVHLNPFELNADLQGFSIASPEGDSLLSFEQLALDINVIESIKQRALVLAAVTLKKPIGNLERRPDGRFNFSDVIDKLSAQDPNEQPAQSSESTELPVLIHQIALQEGQISWLDLQVGQQAKETVTPLNITVSEVSTHSNALAKFGVTLSLASGGDLDWQGDFDLTALSSAGKLKLDGLALTKVWQLFLQELLPLEIADGHLSLQTDYKLSGINDGDLQVLLTSAGIDVKQLNLNEKDKSDNLIHLASLGATGIKLDLKQQQLDIASVTSSDARIKSWLQADGQVNYQSLFAGDNTAPPSNDAEDAAATIPWRIQLGELALVNYQVDFTDFTQPKPLQMQLSELNASLKDYRNQDGIGLPVQFSSRFNKSGSLKFDGNMVLAPFTANLRVDLHDINLKTFQTYINPFLKLELVDGDFDTQGQLKLAAAEQLQLTYQGDANIDNLVTRDKATQKDFVKWTKLDVRQMQLDVAKQDYSLGKVTFDRPYIRFMIKKDKTNNVSDILVDQAGAKPAAATVSRKKSQPETKTPEPVVKIGKIEMKEGKSDFADYSLILPFVVKMNALNGEVDGFASNTDDTINLKLLGKVHDFASVEIKGDYRLQSGDSNISLDFSHMPLALVTPYMAEFVGYKIEKGQMALNLTYSIKNGLLSAENKVFIDQLVLGEKVENPKAISLPLELGVALLKDTDGKINLDFPITGSLEDPEFSVGSLVADVLVNLITKAVTSPFKAMASLFDDDNDYSTVTFAAGNSDLNAEESAKLDQIANALKAKPELVLEVKGVAYEIQDWPVMRFDALKDILKKMKSGELRDKGEKIRSEYIELSDDEYKRLLAKFYAEVFPQKIDRTLFGSPRIKSNPDADFYTVARQELEAVMKPDPERLNDLAVSRANHIAKYLIEHAGVVRSRIYILATELNTKDAEGGINALLSLNVAS